MANISMAGIADVCARVLRSVSKEVCAALFEGGRGQLVLMGRCLVTDRARVFLLTVVAPLTGVDVTVEEILIQDGTAFFGSGASEAERHSHQSGQVAPFHIVKAIADDPQVPSVGGNIQFGVLDSVDFRITDIRDYKINEELREIYVGFYLGGLEILGGSSLFGNSGFAFNKPFLTPFESEVHGLLDRGYTIVDSTRHWAS